MVACIAIVLLEMSSATKQRILIGADHALIAFAIAAVTAKRLHVRAGWLLMIPCLFIVLVMLLNIENNDIGLEFIRSLYPFST